MDQRPRSRRRVIAADDAEPRLSELLDRVEQGEEIALTRSGRAVARLTPGPGRDVAAAVAAIERLTALRKEWATRGVNLTQEEIREMRDAGRH